MFHMSMGWGGPAGARGTNYYMSAYVNRSAAAPHAWQGPPSPSPLLQVRPCDGCHGLDARRGQTLTIPSQTQS